MATEDKFIVAIELGSSKVTGIAGRKQPDGVTQILAFAQEPSTTFIRKGRINNVNKMTQCILNMKEKLEQQLQKSVSRVYVGIGGMGMHTVANTVVKHFDSKVEITQEMVDAMCDENRNTASPDRDILESVPQEYRLGTQVQTDPVGILSDGIEGHFLNIVANQSVREEIRSCFRTAGVAIADLPITVQAAADAMLPEPEKRSGCVFVDMGAETTSVAVYKNNLLRHLAVIPLGGANVNRDIMSLQIEDDEAEELKLKYASAIADNSGEKRKPIVLRDGRHVDFDEFSGLVEARMEEIILNIKNQITLSKDDRGQLSGGLVITGGASHLKDIDKAFVRDTQFEKIRFVRNIRIPLRAGEFGEFNVDGDCNSAIALLDKGEMNCCGGSLGQPPPFEEHKEPEQPVLTPEEQAEEEKRKAEAEALRLKQEAEAKAAAEAAERQRLKEEEERRRKERLRSGWKKVSNFFSKLVSEKDE